MVNGSEDHLGAPEKCRTYPDLLLWNLYFKRDLRCACSTLRSCVLYLRALPGVDEAVDHAEVVERGAEGTALPPTSAGRERAIIGRSLAAAGAGTVI